MVVRTRMAPSPTGEYHIGSMRTMLYNYAFAKKNAGQFILRIEDTDRQRYVEGSQERMLQAIKDYGLSWDEGPEVGGPYAPYTQSDRLSIYKDYALKLIESGDAYHCFCSEERLTQVREEQKKAGFPVTKYDKLCLKLSKEEISDKLKRGEKFVLRFKMPDSEDISFDDIFLGKITFNTKDLDDYILLKSDGFPTYHLAVVVDDYIMKISHVLRGIEWLASTPKHILLYKAFNLDMPLHGHLPNLKEVGANKKLSKRSGTVDANSFLRDGYLPEALLNFLMLLGWNPGTEREIFSLEEFINEFSLERVHKTDLVAFDREKLLWMNGFYIRKLSTSELHHKIIDWAQKFQVDLKIKDANKEYVIKSLSLIQDRMRTLGDFKQLSQFFFEEPVLGDDFLYKFSSSKESGKVIIKNFLEMYASIDTKDWSADNLDKLSHGLLEKLSLKPKEAFMTVRHALTGASATPPLFDVMEVLGKDCVVRRLKVCIN